MSFFDRAQKRWREFLNQQTGENSVDGPQSSDAEPVPSEDDFDDIEDAPELLINPLTIDAIDDLCRESPFPVISSSLRETTIYVNDLDLEISLSEGSKWLLIRTAIPMTPQNSPFEPTDGPLTEEDLDTQLHLLIDATNAWNQQWFQPTAYVDRYKDDWIIRLDNAYFAGAGLTESQFISIIIRTAMFTEQARDEIPALIPPI